MNKKIPLLFSLMFSLALVGCNSGVGNTPNSATTSLSSHQANSSILNAANEVINIGAVANLNSVAYGKNIYVTVGDNGQIATSYDAVNWNAQNSQVTMNLHAITFSEKLQKFYAVGDDGYVLSSSDGINWQIKFPLYPSLALYSVMAIDNVIVIGGENGVVFELTVDVNDKESIVNSYLADLANITTLTYLNDTMFLATSNGNIFTKHNGSEDWTKVANLGNSSITSLSYDQFDKMIIGSNANGEVFVSDSGLEWSKPLEVSSDIINDLILDPISNDFIAVGGSQNKAKIMSSTDFNAWSLIPSNLNKNIHALKCFNDGLKCISVGDGGQIGYVKSRDPISKAPLFTSATPVENQAVALLSEPESFHYTNDKLYRISLGYFGLKTYRVTNVTKNSTITIQSVNIPDNSQFSYDYMRATCFNGKGSSVQAITKLAYGDSCTIVYKYEPTYYQPADWFSSFVIFKDDAGNLVNSNVINTPYSVNLPN